MNAPAIEIPIRRRMNPEEAKAHYDAKYPNRPICCFCGEKTECPYGNSPAPLASEGKCCGKCNNMVIFARIGLISIEDAKTSLLQK